MTRNTLTAVLMALVLSGLAGTPAGAEELGLKDAASPGKQESRPGGDVRDVGDPELIRCCDIEASLDKVWGGSHVL